MMNTDHDLESDQCGLQLYEQRTLTLTMITIIMKHLQQLIAMQSHLTTIWVLVLRR